MPEIDRRRLIQLAGVTILGTGFGGNSSTEAFGLSGESEGSYDHSILFSELQLARYRASLKDRIDSLSPLSKLELPSDVLSAEELLAGYNTRIWNTEVPVPLIDPHRCQPSLVSIQGQRSPNQFKGTDIRSDSVLEETVPIELRLRTSILEEGIFQRIESGEVGGLDIVLIPESSISETAIPLEFEQEYPGVTRFFGKKLDERLETLLERRDNTDYSRNVSGFHLVYKNRTVMIVGVGGEFYPYDFYGDRSVHILTDRDIIDRKGSEDYLVYSNDARIILDHELSHACSSICGTESGHPGADIRLRRRRKIARIEYAGAKSNRGFRSVFVTPFGMFY